MISFIFYQLLLICMGARMRKSVLLGVVFIILVLPIVHADLGVDIETQKYCSPPPAEFTVKITNDQNVEDKFATIITERYRSWTTVKPSRVTLKPGETKEVTIQVDAPESVVSGEYYLPVLSYSVTNESINARRTLCLSLLKKYDAKLISSNITGSVKPGGNAILSIQVENIGTKDFEDMKIKAKLRRNGKLVDEKGISFKLENGIRVRKEIKFPIGEFEEPGEYSVTADITGAGKLFGTTKKTFKVEDIESIDKVESSEETWLTDKRSLKVTNRGNTEYEGNIKVTVEEPWDLLVSTDGNPTVRSIGGRKVYSWYISLKPNSSQQINYQINYWPLYVLGLIIFGILLKLFFVWKSPHIKKRVLEKGGAEEEEAEFTITLEVTNRSLKTLKDVVVRDTIPGIAEVTKDFKSIKPNVNEKDGVTELVWRLADLGPGDERILTYKIKMVVGTSDHFNLPKATLRAKTEKDIKYNKHSNRVKVEASKE